MLKWFSRRVAALGLVLGVVLGVVLWPATLRAQPFDYYLLALTWTPTWCLAEGDAGSEQCDPDRDLGFTLHGLWPQHAAGWPEDCAGRVPDPTRRQTAAMADIMGSGGLAWYEWKKHGRCTGLSAEAYFARSRAAYEGLSLPRPAGGRASAEVLEAVLIAANPGLDEDGVIVTCKGGRVAEVRICLTPELEPRTCGADVLADACRQRGPLEVPPIR